MTEKEHIVHLRAALRRAAGVIDQMHKSILNEQGVVASEPNGEAVIALANAHMDPGEDWGRACSAARAMLTDHN